MDELLYDRINDIYLILKKMYSEYTDEEMKWLKKPFQLIADLIMENFVALVTGE